MSDIENIEVHCEEVDEDAVYQPAEYDDSQDPLNGMPDKEQSLNKVVLSLVNDFHFLEQSDEDIAEEKQINLLYGINADICCHLNCNRKIPKDMAVEHRQEFQEMTKNDQDLVILTHLQSHRQHPDLINLYRSRNRTKSQGPDILRQDISYFFAGMHICKRMYLFLHNVGVKRFLNLVKHYDKHGINQRRHGNENRTPNRTNILSTQDVEYVIHFLKNYAEQFGKACSRISASSAKAYATIKLPSTDTKVSLYKRYVETCEDEENVKKAGKSSFYKIWRNYVPYITVAPMVKKVIQPETEELNEEIYRVVHEVVQEVTDSDHPEIKTLIEEDEDIEAQMIEDIVIDS